jgi:excinuclease ABC subunit C
MAAFSRQLKFEDAGEIKRLLYALEHINDIALVKGETVGRFRTGRQFRLEAYDVAHLGGMETVGAMAVSENGEPTPAGYRKFKLSRNRNDDVAGLAEILSRRLDHPEWPYPDVIVVDGNEVQKKRAEGILSARRLAIPVVAVTKDERHKADRLIGPVELLGRYKRDIVAVNAEAHRFAIKYHRKRRSKRVLS